MKLKKEIKTGLSGMKIGGPFAPKKEDGSSGRGFIPMDMR
jgi:hypothetical protein